MRQGFVVWLTGLSGSGKSALAEGLAPALRERGLPVEVLDGAVIRARMSPQLGYSRQERETNVRRLGFLAQMLTRNGIAVIVAANSPHRAAREHVRAEIGDFVEVFVRCPIEELICSDSTGLYRQALHGEIADLPGVNDVYEPPLNPEVVVDREYHSLDDGIARIVAALESRGYLEAEPVTSEPLRLVHSAR
jgi:adenylylsulfate kinase